MTGLLLASQRVTITEQRQDLLRRKPRNLINMLSLSRALEKRAPTMTADGSPSGLVLQYRLERRDAAKPAALATPGEMPMRPTR